MAASPDAVLVIGASGAIETASPAVQSLFGYHPDELIGQRVEALVPDDLRALHERHQARYRTRPTARAMGSGLALFGQRRDGSTFPVDVSLAPLPIDGEQLVAAYVRDATERRRDEALLRYVNDISRELLAGVPTDEILALTAAGARKLVGGATSWIVVPEGADHLTVAAADGPGSEALIGARVDAHASISARAITTGEPIHIADMITEPGVLPEAEALKLGPGVYVPLHADGTAIGALVVARSAGSDPIAIAEINALTTFASGAAIVLSLGQTRQQVERLQIIADHERIARDLHDSVIQRLFALGMSLQAACSLADPAVGERINDAVDGIDDVIRDIRETIFELGRHATGAPDIRQQLRQVAAESASQLGFQPRVAFRGPVETAVDAQHLDDLLAVAREALSNAARHAQSHAVEVVLMASEGAITLTVADDGIGLPDSPPAGHGLANMEARAARFGGQFTTRARQPNGTVVEWRVPIPEK